MKTSRFFPVLIAATIFILASCVSNPQTAELDEDAPLAAAGARVAIFNFELKGGTPAYASLSTDVAESITEALVRGKVLKPVERRELEKALGEQELGLSGLVDEATAAKIGKLAGARYALLGSASIIGEQVRLSCRLIDVETAEIVFAESSYGDLIDVYDIAEELAKKVEEEFS